jgi:hypothetical protein
MSQLFDNQRQANLSSAVELVEDVLVELGYRMDAARAAIPGAVKGWRVTRGSASVDVSVVERADGHHLRVAASLMTLVGAVDRLALFERLLALNASQLVGVAFALRGEQVFLIGQRSTADLDRSEVRALVSTVLISADELDDRLVAEFGGRLG